MDMQAKSSLVGFSEDMLEFDLPRASTGLIDTLNECTEVSRVLIAIQHAKNEQAPTFFQNPTIHEPQLSHSRPPTEALRLPRSTAASALSFIQFVGGSFHPTCKICLCILEIEVIDSKAKDHWTRLKSSCSISPPQNLSIFLALKLE
ncbi:hypothetical protein GOBAR_AA21490 [Gossypium barbadense]|uniref:Uncharacterized protein n=1 Tax=Gossypium barbadense TaxID=3634 RepID=A0A2P5X769_GOSBA|nr:hypothetical protein GOBAR_AA21490 [Gossypium barbadense]